MQWWITALRCAEGTPIIAHARKGGHPVPIITLIYWVEWLKTWMFVKVVFTLSEDALPTLGGFAGTA